MTDPRDVRITQLEDALRRNRQGYRNILEFRRLSGEEWGQRDGYGGRYGALTREEVETVITEIDAALTPKPDAAPPVTRNSSVLASFTEYCEQNPDQRFWQALRNWSEFQFILGADRFGRDSGGPTIDTFHLEGRNQDDKPAPPKEGERALRGEPLVAPEEQPK